MTFQEIILNLQKILGRAGLYPATAYDIEKGQVRYEPGHFLACHRTGTVGCLLR